MSDSEPKRVVRTRAIETCGKKVAHPMETWLQLGIGGVALVVIVALLRRGLRRRTNAIDVGRVSDAWLAEQRGRQDD